MSSSQGLHVSGPWGSISLTSVDAGRAKWSRHAHGMSRKTTFGGETVHAGVRTTEEFLTVRHHFGVKVWHWQIGGSLRPELAPDGSIRFVDQARVAGPRIDPVEILDGRGHTVTPKSLRWQLTRRDGKRFIALRLDDRHLATPYVIDPAITFRANGTSTVGGNAATLSVNRPAGSAPNDLLIASLVLGGGSNTTFTTIPAGWTQIRRTNNGTAVAVVTFSHVVGATADNGPYAWTLGGKQMFGASIETYTGVNDSSPIVQSSGNIGVGNGVTAAGVTGTAGDWGVVALGSLVKTSFTPSGYGERYDINSGGSSGTVTGEGGDFAMAGGATGNKTANAAGSGAWGAQLIELRLDTTPPTNAVTVSESGANADSYVSGKTFFYRPSSTTGGSFTVAAAVADGAPQQSGIRRVNFPALTGGFTPTTPLDANYPGPYTRAYSWAGNNGASDTGVKVVTAYDNAANTATDSFTIAPDSTAPVTTDNTAALGPAWTSSSTTVLLSPTDSGGSGAAATYSTTNGSAPTKTSPQGTSVVLTADGVYTLKYFSTDNVSNQETVKTAGTQIRIDRTAPTAATVSAPAVIANGGTLSASGSDALSGVASVSYYDCAGTACTPTTLIGTSSTAPNYALAWTSQPVDGVYQVRARVADAAGNTRDSASATVRVDNTAPSGSVTAPAAGANVRQSVRVASDSADSGSGIARVVFQWSHARQNSWTTIATATAAPYEVQFATPQVTDGAYDLRAVTTDVAGNTFTSAAQTVAVDNTAPIVALDDPGSVAQGTTALSATASDASGSGVATVAFQRSPAGANSWTTIGTATSAPWQASWTTAGLADGSYDIRALATDAAGNSTASSVKTIIVENNGHPTANLNDPGASIRGVVTLQASATDALTGITQVAFQRSPAGAASWTPIGVDTTAPYSTDFDTSAVADGLYDLRIVATSGGGNTSNATVAGRRVDNTPPTGELTTPADGALVAGTINVSSSSADAGSGVSEVAFQRSPAGAGAWSTFGTASTAPYQVGLDTSALLDGSYDLRAVTTDDAGNKATSAIRDVTADNSAPDVPTLSFSQLIDAAAVGSSVYFRPGGGGHFTVNATSSDSLSGIAHVDFPVFFDPGWTGGGSVASAPYSTTYAFSSFASTGFGPETVTATNGAQVVSGGSTFTITPDADAPSTSIACDGSGCSNTWYESGVAVALVSTDSGSGVDGIRYTTDGTDPDRSNGATYTKPILLNTSTTLKYRAYDAVNNAEAVQTKAIRIDEVPPTTTISCNGSPCTADWYSPGVSVALSTSDADSGPGTIRYTTDGSTPDVGNGLAYTGPISFGSRTTLKFRGYDAVGNPEAVQTLTIPVDSTAPSVAITSPLANAAVRNGMQLTMNADDGESGVSKVDVRFCPGTSCTWANGTPIDTATSAPYGVTWVNQPADGQYTLLARATDQIGNTSESSPVTVTVDNVADTIGTDGANPIIAENKQAGTTAWQVGLGQYRVADDANGQIKGYASATSVNKGNSIDFKVSVSPAQAYTVDIYRLGCYPDAGGNCLGGRFMRHLGPISGTTQPACNLDGPSGANTGLLECNWTGPSFTVPTTWTSGVYIAQLTNSSNFQNDIVFVVRDDGSHSSILYQQPVNTYQAYNDYPYYGDTRNGKSLYDNSSGGADTIAGAGRTRAVKVSFDRPYAGAGYGDLLDPNGWSWEQYFIHWAEKNGYDLSYSTSVDTQEQPNLLLNHKAWITVGHDEYWSGQMYTNVANARDAGVNLGFFGGNDVYWQVRYEPSSSGAPDRVMVGYKNSPNNTYLTNDPIVSTDPTQATVRFQDPPVNRPGQLLTGTTFMASTERSTKNTPLNVLNGNAWVWDNTGLTDGSSVPGIVGYEVDKYNCMFGLPKNTSFTLLSSSPMQDGDGYWDNSNAVIYRAPSGAWVFNAATMSWNWALDRSTPASDQGLPTGWVNPGIQQATKNVLDGFIGAKPTPDIPSYVPDCATHQQMSFESGSLAVSGPPPAPQDAGDKAFGAVTLESANPIKGSYSEHVPNVGNSYVDKRITAVDDLNLTFYLRISSLPTTDARLAVAFSQVVSQGNIVIRPTGLLCIRNGNAWIAGTPPPSCTSTPLALNTTYRIRLHQVIGTGNDGVLEGYVAAGDDPFGAPFVRSASGALSTRADRVSVGATTVTGLDAYFDNIAVDGVSVTAPAGPLDLTAAAPTDSTEVDLTWTDAATNESSYVVERSDSSSFANPVIVKLPAGTTSYADKAVTTSTPYWYRVKAVNAGGDSEYSGVTNVTTRPPPPAAPTNLVATVLSPTATRLDWVDNAADESNFVVERSPDPLFGAPTVILLPANATTYTDAGLATGPYYYRVKAINIGTTGSAYTNVVRGPRIKDITFEDGTPTLINPTTGADKNAGNGVVLETANPIKGLYSAHVPNAANAYLDQNLPNVDDLYASFYFRLDAIPASDYRIAQVLDAGVTVANVWVRSTGQLCLKYGNNWSGGVVSTGCTPTTKPLSAGTVYRMAIHQRRGDGTSNAVVEAFYAVGDTAFPTNASGAPAPFTSTSVPASAGTTGGYWASQATLFRIGGTLGASPLSATFDDIKLDSSYLPGPSP